MKKKVKLNLRRLVTEKTCALWVYMMHLTIVMQFCWGRIVNVGEQEIDAA